MVLHGLQLTVACILYNIVYMKNAGCIAIVILFLAGCRSGDNKKDEPTIGKEVDTSSTTGVTTQPAVETPKDTVKANTGVERPPAKPSEPPAPSKSSKNPDILARIDNHLVSTPKFTPGTNGGISNASVTVKNTLSGITFQRALLEVSIRAADGSEVRTDYYDIVNLEPGGTKLVSIPDNAKGTRMILHIVKVKSDQLTRGEYVMTGSHAQK
jgi:hypothetical protein